MGRVTKVKRVANDRQQPEPDDLCRLLDGLPEFDFEGLENELALATCSPPAGVHCWRRDVIKPALSKRGKP